MANAEIMIHNVVTGYTQMAMADANGMPSAWRIFLPNRYHLEVKAPGFNQFSQDIDIRNAVPVQVKATLALASETTTVTWKAPPRRLKWILPRTPTPTAA